VPLLRTGVTGTMLAIYEPNSHGHRYHYVRRLIDAANDAGVQSVLFTSQSASTSRECQMHLPAGTEVELVCEDVPDSALSDFTALRRVLSRLAVTDSLVMPDGDRRLVPLVAARSLTGGRRGPAIGVLLMRSRPPSPRALPAYLLKALTARGGRLLGIRTSRLVAPLAPDNQACHAWLRALPRVTDPVPERPELSRQAARAQLGIAEDRTVLLLPGNLDERKCPDVVLDWFRRTRLTPRPLLVLAGRLDDSTRRLVDTVLQDGATTDLRVHDGFVFDELMHTLYAASDAIFCLHRNHGSSGALAHALAHRRPIIAWGSLDVVDVVTANGVGIPLAGLTTDHVDEAIRMITSLAWPEKVDRVIETAASGSGFLLGLAPDLRIPTK
jgi:hypothetical protein